MEYQVTVRSTINLTHDVLRIVTDKPNGYSFTPGQATEVAIDKSGWRNKKRPFTFTSLPSDYFLEFTIKTYPDHKGVTNELVQVKEDDSLIIGDVFGAIAYSGEGLFIAGGAGVTPFISIFRDLASRKELGENKLIFANKTRKDIIHNIEFQEMLGKKFINILSDDPTAGYSHHGYITEEFLQPFLNKKQTRIYLCGPEPMMKSVELHLSNLGVSPDSIVKEVFDLI